MDKLTMPASDIAELVINSREKGYAMIIPVDAMYQLSVALKAAEARVKELETEQAEHDEQIARLKGKFDLAVAGLRSKTARAEKAEEKYAEVGEWYAKMKTRMLAAETQLAELAAQEPRYFYREHNSYNGMKTAWEEVSAEQLPHLKEITDPETAEIIELFDRAAPPVPFVVDSKSLEQGLSVLNETLDDCGDSERGLLLALTKMGVEVADE